MRPVEPAEPSDRVDDWGRRKRRQWGEFQGAPGYESKIGEHAASVDAAIVRALLDGSGRRVLDLPCGAGRMSRELGAMGPKLLVSADYSPDMLAAAGASLANPRLRCDAFALPFASGAFDRLLMLRLVFHYRDPEPLLREAARVLAPGGELVFDTLNRASLRRLAELLLVVAGRRHGVVGVRFHGRNELLGLLAACGLEVVGSESRFLLPTRLYRFLPRIVRGALAAVERFVPSRLRVLTYWRVAKRSAAR